MQIQLISNIFGKIVRLKNSFSDNFQPPTLNLLVESFSKNGDTNLYPPSVTENISYRGKSTQGGEVVRFHNSLRLRLSYIAFKIFKILLPLLAIILAAKSIIVHLKAVG